MYEKINAIKYSKIWKAAESIFSVLLMIFAIGATGVIFASVIARYILKVDVYGGEEIILMIAWWLYFVGGMYGSMEDSQIKAEMMDIFVKNHKVLTKIKAVAKFLEFIVFAASGVLSIGLVKLNIIQMPKTTALKIPFIVAQIPIAIGFLFMALFALYYALLFFFDNRTEVEEEGGAKV